MDNEVRAWLYDVLNAIMEIDSFFIDSPKEFSTYKNEFEPEEQLKETSR
jgi:hypothetical protein